MSEEVAVQKVTDQEEALRVLMHKVVNSDNAVSNVHSAISLSQEISRLEALKPVTPIYVYPTIVQETKRSWWPW